MKKYLSFTIFLFLFISSLANVGQQSLWLTANEIEALFLKQNLQLIAEQMNIGIADAEIVQAKLWDNPTLSIGDVNLWSTKSQREGESEVIPPVFGSFARNTQFSIELSQLIQTANKRGKLVSREKVAKDIAVQEFEVVLRGLKAELRKAISEIIYLQNYQQVLAHQQESLNGLIESYKKQEQKGNIARSELLRLQSSLLELESENNETQGDLEEQLKSLKSLLSIDPFVEIRIVETDADDSLKPDAVSLSQLLQQTAESRTDIKLSKLQTRYFERSLAYEKSLRMPDLEVSVSYDRRGGVWQNFIGFGVSVDLPFFNRNQGAIKAARLNHEQSLYIEKQQINQAQHEVVEAYNNYLRAYRFFTKIKADDLLSSLDNMLDIYTKNLLNKNISMVEYIDFMDAYKSNKETVLTARKKMHMQFEELQYVVGIDIKETL